MAFELGKMGPAGFGGHCIPLLPPLEFQTPKVTYAGSTPFGHLRFLAGNNFLAFLRRAEEHARDQVLQRENLSDAQMCSSLDEGTFRVKMQKATQVFGPGGEFQATGPTDLAAGAVVRAKICVPQMWVRDGRVGLQMAMKQLRIYTVPKDGYEIDSEED